MNGSHLAAVDVVARPLQAGPCDEDPPAGSGSQVHGLDDITRIASYAVACTGARWKLTPTEAQDLRQEAVIAALAASNSYDPTRKVPWEAWIMLRLRGQLIDSLRKLRNGGITGEGDAYIGALDGVILPYSHERTPDDEEAPEIEQECQRPQPDEAAAHAEALERLEQGLGFHDRRILTLYYGLGGSQSHTVSELAHVLGYSRKHTFNLLQRAQRRARAIAEGRKA